ncbi:hypothetical protein AOLI_G00056220 [Acnodon oligacanthus]
MKRGAFRASGACREDGDEDEPCVFGAGAGPADDRLLRRLWITTFKDQFCMCSLSPSTKCEAAVLPTTLRVTTPRARAITGPDQCCLNFVTSKIPEKEIRVEKTPSDCPKQGCVVTTSEGKFCTEQNILASFTQQQITEPPGFFNVTKPTSKLNKTEDVRASTTRRQSTVETTTALSKFCMP